MSRPAAFTQADVTKLLKGAKSAGVELSRIEIDRSGKIIAHIGKPEEDGTAGVDAWDQRIRAQNKRSAPVRN